MTVRNYAAIARRYAEAVVGGDIAACQWVRLACQRQLDDLVRFKGRNSPYRFNPRLTDKQGRSFQPADNLCAFVERLPHVKGPLAGQPIHLDAQLPALAQHVPVPPRAAARSSDCHRRR